MTHCFAFVRVIIDPNDECAALIAQGLSTYQAGCMGSWLAGRAAELALAGQSDEAFAASDVIENLGAGTFAPPVARGRSRREEIVGCVLARTRQTTD